MITIFTPTYNRAYILEKLYDSLCNQNVLDFEWLIVDDGSTDDTSRLVHRFMQDGKINIRYIQQPNGGKHVAINRGVMEAKGELFFIVDSDDQLSRDAVSVLESQYSKICNDVRFAGLSGIRVNKKGQRIGGELGVDILDCSPLDLRMRYKVRGDMAEVFKTSVLRKFPFPVFDGERFCPEALVWNRISQKYIMRFMNAPIYECEYLPDGLTAKIAKLRMKSPQASLLYYSELYAMDIPLSQKLKAAVNYWRFAFCSSMPFRNKIHQIGWSTLCLYPLGLLFHFRDLRS